MKSLRNKIRQKWIFIRNLLEDDAGLSVVEMILILVANFTIAFFVYGVYAVQFMGVYTVHSVEFWPIWQQ